MDTGKLTREQISRFADGELDEQEAADVLRLLRDPENQEQWALYHQIGDALRSEEMAAPVSADFSARMAARLEAEPALLAPRQTSHRSSQKDPGWMRMRALPGVLTAAAAASMAFVIAPQFMARYAQETLPATATTATAPVSHGALLADAGQAVLSDAQVSREAEIDNYILMHQSANHSLYGTAQLARPVAAVGTSEK